MRTMFAVLLVVAPLLGAVPASAQAPAPAPAESVVIPADPYYKLQPSDVVVVKYRYTPEYDATVSVRPDGFITLPIVGEVKVSGFTVAEASREVRTAAELRLRDPEMTFELKDFQKPRFVVGGEVDKPGQFELRGRITVLEAIAMAGGFKNSAKHSDVVLFRRYDETRAVTRVINAKQMAKADRIQEDPDLRPGDFLFVPQNKISKVERLIPFASIGWLIAPWIRY
jgi:polysaccharide export outer membrane protein